MREIALLELGSTTLHSGDQLSSLTISRGLARRGRAGYAGIGHSVFYLAEDVRRLVAEGLRQGIETRVRISPRNRNKLFLQDTGRIEEP